MADLIPLLASAFILGLLGAGHCLGMCGGLMGALTMSIPAEQQNRRLRIIMGYNLGRVSSYAVAGFIFGLFGWAVEQTPAANALRVVAALLLISLGLYLAGWWHGLTRIEKLGSYLWKYIQPLASRLLPVKGPLHAVLLGMLWGWLPCGLVYSTLFWAASQGDATTSALLMFTFGLGTWPVLLASGLAAEQVTAFLRKRNVRYAAGLLVILYGLWTLPGPHQHWLMGH